MVPFRSNDDIQTVQTPKTGGKCSLHRFPALRDREGTTDLRVPRGKVGGAILVHDVDVRVGGDLAGQEAGDLGSPRRPSRENEMPHQQTTAGHASLIQPQIAHLPVHLENGGAVPARIVGHAR